MSDSKIQSLNIWTDGFSSDVHTRNVTRQWAFVGQDTEEEYYANKRNPANVDKITYEPDEVIYKFNSLGVRSEEFVKEDCEILYGGCSVTSRAGLPVEHIWTSQLNSMINAEFGTNLKLHSVAKVGISCDAITRRIYTAIEELGLRPKIVIAHFPSIFRTEMFSANISTDRPQIDYLPSNTLQVFLEDRYMLDSYDRTIRLSNLINDYYKNLILLKHVCEKHGIIFKFSSWTSKLHIGELPHKSVGQLPEKYLNGKMIHLNNLIDDHMPESLKEHYVPSAHLPLHFVAHDSNIFKQTVARDFMHSGPNYHHGFAKIMFDVLHPDLKELYD